MTALRDISYRMLLRDGAPALALLLTYAAGAGSRFIYLDVDADTHPGLPLYEDEEQDNTNSATLLGKDLMHRSGQVEVDPGNWRTIINTVIDTDGHLGGDPGDIVVSFDGDSRAYAPNQPVRWRTGPHNVRSA